MNPYRLVCTLPIAALAACAAPGDPGREMLDVRQQPARADSILEHHPARLLVFTRLDGQWTPVRDTIEWPEGDVDLNLWLDPSGRVVTHVEIPRSLSGDWMVTYTHYFDSDGGTIGFASEAAWFNSGCSDILRRSVLHRYDRGFVLSSADTAFSTAEGEAVDPTGCALPYDFTAEVLPSYTALVDAMRAPRRP